MFCVDMIKIESNTKWFIWHSNINIQYCVILHFPEPLESTLLQMVAILPPKGLEFCSVAIATESTSDAKRTETWLESLKVKWSDRWRFFQRENRSYGYLGCGPLPVTVTTMIITCLVWYSDRYSYNLHLLRLLGGGPHAKLGGGPHPNDIHMMIHGCVFFPEVSLLYWKTATRWAPTSFSMGLFHPL